MYTFFKKLFLIFYIYLVNLKKECTIDSCEKNIEDIQY